MSEFTGIWWGRISTRRRGLIFVRVRNGVRGVVGSWKGEILTRGTYQTNNHPISLLLYHCNDYGGWIWWLGWREKDKQKRGSKNGTDGRGWGRGGLLFWYVPLVCISPFLDPTTHLTPFLTLKKMIMMMTTTTVPISVSYLVICRISHLCIRYFWFTFISYGTNLVAVAIIIFYNIKHIDSQWQWR